MRRIIRALAMAAAFAAPAGAAADDVLVMGDSVMAWNRSAGASIGDALGRRLGRRVVNASVPGAQVEAGVFGFALNIGRQYRRGDWDWVVLNGGANDLFRRCGCRQGCETVLDGLIAADGRRGRIATLAARLRGEGAQLMYVGYYGPSGRGGAFDACTDELLELDRRVARMADIVPGIHFVDAGQAISSADPTDYASDNIHPGPRGSARIATLVARGIVAAERRQ